MHELVCRAYDYGFGYYFTGNGRVCRARAAKWEDA